LLAPQVLKKWLIRLSLFRLALIYLNEPAEGGHTGFPRLNKSIEPKIGRLLIFANVRRGTNIRHPLSEHAGLPITSGEKWAVTTWFRENPLVRREEDQEGIQEQVNEEVAVKALADQATEVLDKAEAGVVAVVADGGPFAR
jgi:hypothetical protein